MTQPAYDEFIKLRTAVIRAVGIAWNDPEFKSKLLEDALDAMREQFDYECPFNIKFTVKDGPLFDRHHYNADMTGGWIGSNNSVTFYIPPAPSDQKCRPEALAALGQQTFAFLPLKPRSRE